MEKDQILLTRLPLFKTPLEDIIEDYNAHPNNQEPEDYSLLKKKIHALLLATQSYIQTNPHEQIDVNTPSKIGNTLLHHVIEAAAHEATMSKQSDMLNFTRYLFDHNANPNIQNDYGKTAFFYCMWYCLKRGYLLCIHTDTSVQVLDTLTNLFLDHHADPNISSRDEDFLCILGDRNYSETIQRILNLVDIKKYMYNKDKEGSTPAHTAAGVLNIEFLRILAHAGADFNIKNSSGNTPLQSALTCKDFIVEWKSRIFSVEQADTVINFLSERTQLYQ
jgi:ankyrin repeat protein